MAKYELNQTVKGMIQEVQNEAQTEHELIQKKANARIQDMLKTVMAVEEIPDGAEFSIEEMAFTWPDREPHSENGVAAEIEMDE